MAEQITHYQKCACGAITVWFENNASNSMFMETFENLQLDISDAEQLPDSCCCNHCVNHWGIDLCECGSGSPVGKCACGSKQSHDTLGVQFDSFGALVRTFQQC